MRARASQLGNVLILLLHFFVLWTYRLTRHHRRRTRRSPRFFDTTGGRAYPSRARALHFGQFLIMLLSCFALWADLLTRNRHRRHHPHPFPSLPRPHFATRSLHGACASCFDMFLLLSQFSFSRCLPVQQPVPSPNSVMLLITRLRFSYSLQQFQVQIYPQFIHVAATLPQSRTEVAQCGSAGRSPSVFQQSQV